MMTSWILLATLISAGDASGTIVGTVENGTRDHAVLANAEIVLRASRGGSWVVIAETTSDDQGNFSLTGLDVAPQTIYQAGVNWQGIHYPGARVQFRQTQGNAEARVNLVAYDAVESPSPLICRRYKIQLRPQVGFCDITETLEVDNPTLTTYVGETSADHPTVTLKWDLPPGVEKVTFEKEFHGRNFHFTPRGLATQLPWKPGRQEIRFSYRIPVVEARASLARSLGLPTEQTLVEVTPEAESVRRGDTVQCSLPQATVSGTQATATADVSFVTFSSQQPLAAGDSIEIRWNVSRLPWEIWARWGIGGLLVLLLAGGLWLARGTKRTSTPAASKEPPSPGSTPVPRPSRQFLRLHRRRRDQRSDRAA